MNSTITKLAIAAPLATIGLTLVPAAAMATLPGPIVVAQPDPGPQDGPKDKVGPKTDPVDPQGSPKDKVGPKTDPVDPQGGPKDKVGPKTDPVDPDGPGGITNPHPCPTHGVDCDGKDDPEEGDEPTNEDRNDVGDTISLPKRIDAGQASATEQGDDLELVWLIAGGALVTASGAALAVRARRRTA
jgi:hypothetical protein